MSFKGISGQVLAVSGNANNTSNAGAWYWNSNNSSGNTNANIGSQLSYLIYNCHALIPCLLAKHKQTIKKLVTTVNASNRNSR